jgi:hypothetical protein
VDVQLERVWLLTRAELKTVAQQASGGRLHFYMYTDPDYRPKKSGTHHLEFEHFLIDRRIEELFGYPRVNENG